MLPWLQKYQQQFHGLVKQSSLAHAMLITGPEGVGKTSLANWLIASLLCTNTGASNAAGKSDARPCEQCKSCLLRHAGNHADLLVVDTTQNSIGVDAVRHITLFMQSTAQQQQNKLVLLRHAERLTEAAANALLKTLEEPPKNSYLLLLSPYPARLTATLLSRLQHWPLAAQFDRHALHWLEQHSNRAVPEFLLSYCSGGPLKALNLLESGQADHIQTALQLLQQFFSERVSLQETVKQLLATEQVATILGFYLRQTYMPQLLQINAERLPLAHQYYMRWCRDEQNILGQNKSLALSALLTELRRLRH
jgi:DNA polymerase III subunit delta'